MNRMRIMGFGVAVTAAALLAACSSASTSGTRGFTSSPGVSGDGSGSSTGPGENAGSASPPSTSGGSTGSSSNGNGDGGVAAGILTAGAWDDNRNFDLFETYVTGSASLTGKPPLADQELRDAFAIWSGARAAKQTLDVSLVLDTTGSMGDELRYISTEFLALHTAIEAKYPNADQRWSLVAYKDVNDPYIVEPFDFTTNPNDFVANLSALSASGGGDTPESPERALEAASKLSWRDDATAKLAFWVSDAPHHDQDAAIMAQSLRDVRARGVHLYPVMASGADDLTELTMREGAQLTGGRLLFLTDDSGVGNSHTEPRIPCYFVTKLNDAVSRMIDIELTGTYREPTATEVIRTGGNPESGRCTLSDGQTVSVF